MKSQIQKRPHFLDAWQLPGALHGVPAGVSGTVVEVRVFNRRGVDKDERALAIEKEEIERLAKDRDDQIRIIEANIHQRLKGLLLGKQSLKSQKGLKEGQIISEKTFSEIDKIAPKSRLATCLGASQRNHGAV